MPGVCEKKKDAHVKKCSWESGEPRTPSSMLETRRHEGNGLKKQRPFSKVSGILRTTLKLGERSSILIFTCFLLTHGRFFSQTLARSHSVIPPSADHSPCICFRLSTWTSLHSRHCMLKLHFRQFFCQWVACPVRHASSSLF